MVERLIEPEVSQALDCINRGENFILTGGAGSGKTYSLVSLINEVRLVYPSSSIVCITYTNNAVAEIRNRISISGLSVSTIHEFLWNIIKKFQKEIKKTITKLINEEKVSLFRYPIEFESDEPLTIDFFKDSKIVYDEYYNLRSDKNSSISHDHILIVAEKMFEEYDKLKDILKDSANFIFVDEYQDTNPLVSKILLQHLSSSKKSSIIGFFGDSMQSIYDDGVGSIADGSLVKIIKKQNRRNPQAVINISNHFRDDGLIQVASNDTDAKNMENGRIIEGSSKFVYGKDLNSLTEIKLSEIFETWNFNNPNETKELRLVHKSNAQISGFERLYELYNSDKIIELVSKIRAKNIDLHPEATFEDAVDQASIARGRAGSKVAYIDSDIFEPFLDFYEEFKNLKWSIVSNFRINSESLLSYKYNGLTETYEGRTTRDIILKKMDMIYSLIELYQNKKYNEFLRKTNNVIENSYDKETLKTGMDKFLEIDGMMIEEAMSIATIVLKLPEDDLFEKYINGSGFYLWNRMRKLPFQEYINSIKYQKEFFPYATQHSVKGSEFENVLVVLDNMKWNKYNFKFLFDEKGPNIDVYNRTRRIFYVCITRAKRNLVVFMPTSDESIINKAKSVFGDDNVYDGEQLKLNLV